MEFSPPLRKVGVVVMQPFGQSPVHQAIIPSFLDACEQCDEVVVRYYLGQNCPEILNERDKTGKTGLSHACANGFISIVSLLRRTDADPTLADNEGNHPLIFAAQAGHADIVSLLLSSFSGIDMDQPNKQGFTALMKAAIQGRARCAKLLLYAGATPYKRDFGRGLCALEWAEYCGRQSTARMISQFMDACSFKALENCGVAGSSESSRLRDGHGCYMKSRQSCSVGCAPFRILHKARQKSLPSSRTSSSSSGGGFSPLHSLEDIARICYSPVFPDVSPPSSRKSSSGVSSRRRLVIPKVEVTMTSKDDNYFYENPSRTTACAYKKYFEDSDIF